jgi:hypothetical protein
MELERAATAGLVLEQLRYLGLMIEVIHFRIHMTGPDKEANPARATSSSLIG